MPVHIQQLVLSMYVSMYHITSYIMYKRANKSILLSTSMTTKKGMNLQNCFNGSRVLCIDESVIK